MNLRVFEVINDPGRVSGIDFLRSLAIIAVVLHHFNALPFGLLGVDLFFIISGFLIGGILTKSLKEDKKIRFFRFFVQRGFKIWPSYYIFLFFGSILAYLLYANSRPGEIIPLWDLKRYVFFYQNYTGAPYHWSFDHIWSLCVEEHFYILLPLMYITIQSVFKAGNQKKMLFVSIILLIISGFVFKNLSYIFMKSPETYASTHNRIDALAWGVLLNYILIFYPERFSGRNTRRFFFGAGLLLAAGTLLGMVYLKSAIFEKVYFHTLFPISFSCILFSLYFVDFSKLKILRFIAYYSYNWYLWHPVFVFFILDKIGNNIGGLLVYLVLSFAFAFAATVLVEETFLGFRDRVISRLFDAGREQKRTYVNVSVCVGVPLLILFLLPSGIYRDWYNRNCKTLVEAYKNRDRSLAPKEILYAPETCVILALGQSNSANCGAGKYECRHEVLNYCNKALYWAREPLLGADCSGSSVWTRLGDLLIESRQYKRVVIIPIGVDGSTVDCWANGSCRNKLEETLQQIREDKIKVTHVVWHQGESDNICNTAKNSYKANLGKVLSLIRREGIGAPFYVCQASYVPVKSGRDQLDSLVRQAQLEFVKENTNTRNGPDTDLLVSKGDRRADGLHFSEKGLDKFAAELYRKMQYE